MNLMSKKLALIAAILLPLSADVLADNVNCPGGVVNGPNGLQCAPTELPEPSTPLLFLGAAGVAIAARAIRNRKK